MVAGPCDQHAHCLDLETTHPMPWREGSPAARECSWSPAAPPDLRACEPKTRYLPTWSLSLLGDPPKKIIGFRLKQAKQKGPAKKAGYHQKDRPTCYTDRFKLAPQADGGLQSVFTKLGKPRTSGHAARNTRLVLDDTPRHVPPCKLRLDPMRLLIWRPAERQQLSLEFFASLI